MTIMARKNAQDGEWIILPLVYNSFTNTDTGYDLPANAVIFPHEMFLQIYASGYPSSGNGPDSGETIDIGIGIGAESGYDYDGFVDGWSLTTAGVYCVADMYTCTDATSQNYISANYIGALFFGGIAGANAAGQAGIMATKRYVGDGTCKSICYTCSTGSDTFYGQLIFKVHQLPLERLVA